MPTFSFDLHCLKAQRENWGGGERDNNPFPFLFLFKPTGLTQQAAKQYRPAFPLLSPPQREPSIPQTVPWWEPCLASELLSSWEVADILNQRARFREAGRGAGDWQDQGRRGRGSQSRKEG